jgi:hypothetical protein
VAADRQLSRDFWLREFPGWESATEKQIGRLEMLVTMILQPARRVHGKLQPTSWLRPGAKSAHATGDAVDFVALETSNATVHEWIATFLPGAFGELILEPNNRAVGGGGAHVHVTNWGYGGRGEVLVERELEEGRYDLGVALASIPGTALLGFLLVTLALALLVRFSPTFRLGA